MFSLFYFLQQKYIDDHLIKKKKVIFFSRQIICYVNNGQSRHIKKSKYKYTQLTSSINMKNMNLICE